MTPQPISANDEGGVRMPRLKASPKVFETVGATSLKKRKRLRSIRDRNALRHFKRQLVEFDPQDSTASDDSNGHSCPAMPCLHIGIRSSGVIQGNPEEGKDVRETKRLKSGQRQRKGQDCVEEGVNMEAAGVGLYLESSSSRTSFEETSSLIQNPQEEEFDCPLCSRRRFRETDALVHHLLHGHSLDLSEEDIKRLKYLLLFKREEVSPALNSSPPSPKYSRPYDSSKRVAKRCPSSSVSPPTADLEVTTPVDLPASKSKARLVDGSCTCLKCSSTFDSESKLLLHVKLNHVWNPEEICRLIEIGAEMEPSEFWCPECGTTFVTKSALIMHLKGSHEFVHDVHGYLEQVGYEGDVPAVENQCTVCFRILNSSWEFEKHVRNHGLAFLRRQQLLTKLRTG